MVVTRSARPEVSGARVAHNTLLNFLGQALPLAMALVAVRYLLPGLGADRFGVLSLMWILVGYFMVVGFGSAATKHIAEVLGTHADRVAPIAWTAAAVQLGIGLLGGLALVLFAEPLVRLLLDADGALHAEAVRTFRWLGFAIPVVMVSTVFQGVLEAAQRFDLVNLVRVPSIIATFALPLVGMWLGFGLPGIALLLVAGKLAILVALVLLARRAVPEIAHGRVRMDGTELRAITSFGAWASVSSATASALHYMDRIGLGMVAGAAAVGFYAAPFEVVTRLRMAPGALVSALFPAISSLDGAGDRERGMRMALTSMHLVLLFMGVAAVALIGGAHDLLRLWLGAEAEARAATATQVLAAGLVVNSLSYVPFVLLQGLGRPDVPARLYLLQVPVQLLLVWFCVSRWGITGAALAWSAHVTIDFMLLAVASARLGGRRPLAMFDRGMRRSALLIVAASGAALAVSSGVAPFWPRVGALVLTVATLAVLGWTWSLDEAERTKLVGLARGYMPRRVPEETRDR